ncbi:hypothetical protein BD413DRAFT_264495 [Trametes elegans]|nr:hypothetical protein BD413DRAFT_264495 [Trametes elegans]
MPQRVCDGRKAGASLRRQASALAGIDAPSHVPSPDLLPRRARKAGGRGSSASGHSSQLQREMGRRYACRYAGIWISRRVVVKGTRLDMPGHLSCACAGCAYGRTRTGRRPARSPEGGSAVGGVQKPGETVPLLLHLRTRSRAEADAKHTYTGVHSSGPVSQKAAVQTRVPIRAVGSKSLRPSMWISIRLSPPAAPRPFRASGKSHTMRRRRPDACITSQSPMLAHRLPRPRGA